MEFLPSKPHGDRDESSLIYPCAVSAGPGGGLGPATLFNPSGKLRNAGSFPEGGNHFF
jgi:hypothetical protein